MEVNRDKLHATGMAPTADRIAAERQQVLAEAAARANAGHQATPPGGYDEPKKGTRNILTNGQSEVLGSVIRGAILRGEINPFTTSNAAISVQVHALLFNRGEVFECTEANIKNAIARLFGVNPGKRDETPDVIPFEFTASPDKAPISFKFKEVAIDPLKAEEDEILQRLKDVRARRRAATK